MILLNSQDFYEVPLPKAAGTGEAGQAKTSPPFSALGLVMIVNCIGRMVKIVTIERSCSTVQPDDCRDLLCRGISPSLKY